MWKAVFFVIATATLVSCNDSAGPSDGFDMTTMTVSPPGPLKMLVGKTQAFTVVTDPPGHDVVWTSDVPNVVSVDQEGVATALAPGGATITATLTGGAASKSVPINVTQGGIRNPSFEDPRMCNYDTSPTPLPCGAEWLDDSECQQNICTNECKAFKIAGQGVQDMPTDGMRTLGCPGNAYVYQDGVDFGDATTITFDYLLTTDTLGTCPHLIVTMKYIKSATTTLWTTDFNGPCGSGTTPLIFPLTTVTVPIPTGLEPGGRLMLSSDTVDGGFVFFDHFRVE